MEDDEYEEGMEMGYGGHHQHGGGHAGYGAEEDDEMGYGGGGGDGGEMEEEADGDPEQQEEITQDDAWAVISAYFEEKGLVRQQLDSFDEFIQNTMQEIVDESADIEIRPESQHNPGRQAEFAEVVASLWPLQVAWIVHYLLLLDSAIRLGRWGSLVWRGVSVS